MATRRRNKTSVSHTVDVTVDMVPIDYIDLTVESVAISALRRARRRTENAPYNIPEVHSEPSQTRRRSRRCHDAGLQDSVVEEPNETVDENRTDVLQLRAIDPAEIINLDDSEQHITPCINDSCTGQSRVLTCPICFEELSNKLSPTSTRCGHVFCAECLQKTVKTTKKCPLCKRNVNLRSCTRLHL